jgi:hypothetical protein
MSRVGNKPAGRTTIKPAAPKKPAAKPKSKPKTTEKPATGGWKPKVGSNKPKPAPLE